MLNSTATQWRHRFDLQISMEKGSIILSGILSGSKSYGHEKVIISYRGEHDEGNPIEESIQYNEDNSWKREIEDFASYILEDTEVESGNSHDAFKTMELVYKIYCADPEWKKKYNLTDSAE